MAKRIFITATNTDVGKTYTTKILIKEYAEAGYRVGVIKPIETGVSQLPPDGSELLETVREFNPEMVNLTVNDIVPIQLKLPAAPYIANGANPIDLSKIERALDKIENLCDIILIEGAGGLMVPVDKELMIIDLIKHFNAKALLVTHCQLGCINDTLLSLSALENAGIPHEWVLNCRENDTTFQQVSLPYFQDHFREVHLLSNDLKRLAKSLLL